jgi:hypothetical protein
MYVQYMLEWAQKPGTTTWKVGAGQTPSTGPTQRSKPQESKIDVGLHRIALRKHPSILLVHSPASFRWSSARASGRSSAPSDLCRSSGVGQPQGRQGVFLGTGQRDWLCKSPATRCEFQEASPDSDTRVSLTEEQDAGWGRSTPYNLCGGASTTTRLAFSIAQLPITGPARQLERQKAPLRLFVNSSIPTTGPSPVACSTTSKPRESKNRIDRK